MWLLVYRAVALVQLGDLFGSQRDRRVRRWLMLWILRVGHELSGVDSGSETNVRRPGKPGQILQPPCVRNAQGSVSAFSKPSGRASRRKPQTRLFHSAFATRSWLRRFSHDRELEAVGVDQVEGSASPGHVCRLRGKFTATCFDVLGDLVDVLGGA